VDAGSTDGTQEICRQYTDKLFLNPWPGFVEQKNFAVDRATHDWVLSIDADERASPALRQEIQAVLARPDHAEGYSIPRRNIFLGRWMRHGGWYPDRVLRLFRKSRGRFGGINPHALVELQGKVMKLEEPLLHLTYHSLSQYIEKQYRYACTAAQERLKGRPHMKVGVSTLAARPILKFLETYVVKRGFLDGTYGLITATFAAYFAFVKYARLWELSRMEAEADWAQP
jgi:glycosyltransferase involved in cell wall biosynthesis